MENVELTVDKLERLTFYIRNAKMSKAHREILDRSIVTGILTGTLDVDNLFPPPQEDPVTSVTQFVSQIESNGGGEFGAMKLYHQYCDWCNERTAKIVSLTQFGQYLVALGAQKIKRENGNYYVISGEK